jgi:hypothetical protein
LWQEKPDLRRNKLVFEEVFLHPDEVYEGAIKSLGDFKACIQETNRCTIAWKLRLLGEYLLSSVLPLMASLKLIGMRL